MQLRDPCEAAPALNFRERQVIAAVVRKNEIADEFSLIGEYFTDAAWRRIFEAASIRLERGELFDEHSLGSDLEPVVRSHLMAMMEELPGEFGMIAPYAAGLRGDYLKRGARAVADSLTAATNSTEEPEAIIDAAHARLDELQEGRGSARTCRAGEAAVRVEKAALEAKCNGIPRGLASGIPPLDEILQRLRGGQLIVGAGGTGSGKTSLATNIAANLARVGIAVGYFTLEMGAEDIAVRLIAGETGTPVGDILSGCLSQDEVSRIRQATQEIDGWPLHIERCNALDAAQLMRRASTETQARHRADCGGLPATHARAGALVLRTGERGHARLENRQRRTRLTDHRPQSAEPRDGAPGRWCKNRGPPSEAPPETLRSQG